MIEIFTAKIEVDSEPLVIVEPNVLHEPESEVAGELDHCKKKLLLGSQK